MTLATVTRGSHDPVVEKVKTILDQYERAHPGATADLYRLNCASVRIRIVSEQFAGWSLGKRHKFVWEFISTRLTDEECEDVAMLLLFVPQELNTSCINREFDDPIPWNL